MASSNVIGLLFQIDADPSKGTAAVENFAKETGQSVGAVQAQIKDYNRAMSAAYDEQIQHSKAAAGVMDEGLLSNRESARLLSEEFGLHLPRAITSSISRVEALQGALQVAGMAAIGIFAGEELFKGVERLTDYVRDSFYEQTEDAKMFATAAEAAYKHAEEAAKSAFTQFKTTAAGGFEIADIDARVDHLLKVIDAYKTLNAEVEQGADMRVILAQDTELAKTIAGAAKEGIQDIETAQQKLAEAGQLQFDARQRQKELEKKDQAQLTKQHEADAREWVATEKQKALESARAAHQIEEGARRQVEVEHRLHEGMIKAGQEAGKVAAAIMKANDEAAASAIRMAKADLQFTLDLEKLGVVEQKNLNFLKEYTPNVYTAAAATEHLGQQRKMLAGVTQDLQQVEDAFKKALQGDRTAMDSMMEGAEGAAEAIASMTHSTKAVAYVRGGYDAAKAIECMAAYIESYGTDVPQLLASIQWAAAADQQFSVAGSGSRHGGGGGGGGGGYASRYGASPSGSGRGSGGGGENQGPQLPGMGPSSQHAGVSVSMAIYGHVFADNLQTLANKIGQGIQNGTIKSFPVTQSPVTKGLL